MIQKTHGTIHGKTIEIEDDLGLPDGEQVEVTIERVAPEKQPAWGEGLARSRVLEDPAPLSISPPRSSPRSAD